ncbi:MAG TPA: glycosyltransferase family 2 protein [Thermoplasmata archaeon]|nr:glycosyltransferase family 2 protein [Thermoplasmata archaeon]
MARTLVVLFLGTVAFAALTIAIGLVHFARDVLVLLGDAIPQLAGASSWHVPSYLAFNGIWFQFAVYYFFLVVPLGVLLLLLVDYLLKDRETRWKIPPQIPVHGQPIAVVLTAYNDEASIGHAVDEFRSIPDVRHVIVVDNNCRDRTAEVAREHGAIVITESQQGYGFACIAGLRHALTQTDDPLVVLSEGDMTFFGNDVQKLVPYLADCDMVVGTRTTRSLTRPGSQMDWFMIWGNIFLAVLIRLRYWDWDFLGRVQLTDVGCTFRAIRRDSLARIIDRLTVGTYHFSPHMILVALQDGMNLTEAPVKFRPRMGESKGAGGSRTRAIQIGLAMLGSIMVH